MANYLHNVRLARDYAPGDLYINGDGWNVSGSGHYSADTFTNTEGWDYVVTGTGVHNLNSSTITKTSGPSNYIWREEQAWKGGIS
jgi:hypothetical protein